MFGPKVPLGTSIDYIMLLKHASQMQAGDDILIGQNNSGYINIIVFPRACSGYVDWTPKD